MHTCLTLGMCYRIYFFYHKNNIKKKITRTRFLLKKKLQLKNSGKILITVSVNPKKFLNLYDCKDIKESQ